MLLWLRSLGMKINAKLGGTNVRLAGSQREAMPHIGQKAAMFIGERLLLSQPRRLEVQQLLAA